MPALNAEIKNEQSEYGDTLACPYLKLNIFYRWECEDLNFLEQKIDQSLQIDQTQKSS